jgi:uncharacterized membrane protein YoaT (DUF817 family)
MYLIITQAEEGQTVARYFPMAFRMLCLKTQKPLTLWTSKLVNILIKNCMFTHLVDHRSRCVNRGC